MSGSARRRHVPLDVPVIVGYVLVVAPLVLVTPFGVATGPLAIALGFPLLFLFPGYALLAVLYPARGATPSNEGSARRRGLAWPERIAMSVGASVALLPLLGILLSLARAPLEPAPIVGSLAVLTVLGVVTGALRRWQLPPEARFRVPLGQWLGEARAAITGTDSPLDTALNVLLVVAVVAATSAMAYGLVAPQRGESFTEVALLADSGGELVQGNYTTRFAPSERGQYVVSIENQEGHQVTYAVVVVLERVRPSGADLTVLQRDTITRLTFTVNDGETRRKRVTVQPTMIGSNLRLSFYAYRSRPPATPTGATADEHLYLWIDVAPPGAVTSNESGPGGTDQSTPGGTNESSPGGANESSPGGTNESSNATASLADVPGAS